ncbi:MAG: 50S ribosomal protein L25/general stress protein Ctc [Pseudomonadota bacterium]
MAEMDVFDCEVRARTGTGGARAVRRDGWVPGVLYGGGDPVAIKLKFNQVNNAYRAGRMGGRLANIDVVGEDGLQPVIAREVQIHPVKGFPMHVDMLRVDEKTRIDVEVPVRFVNEEESPGLKRGGVLNVVRHAVEVYAPATAIPEFFEVDVAGLDIGDSANISLVTLPNGVEPTITDRDFTIATIAAPSAVKSASQEDDEAAEEAAEASEEAAAEGEQEEGGDS